MKSPRSASKTAPDWAPHSTCRGTTARSRCFTCAQQRVSAAMIKLQLARSILQHHSDAAESSLDPSNYQLHKYRAGYP